MRYRERNKENIMVGLALLVEHPIPVGIATHVYKELNFSIFPFFVSAKITLFYIIFYIILAAFVAICMQGLLATVNDQEPRWQLGASLIGENPGLGYRPLGNDTDTGAVIQFDTKKTKEGEQWILALDEFMDRKYQFSKYPPRADILNFL